MSVVALAILSLLCTADASSESELYRGVSNYSFPDNFLFGIGTSAFQIEGAWDKGGKGESVWDSYIHNHPNFTLDHANGDIATDSYHKYREDVAMVKSLGLKYYRISLSWPRILPNGTDNFINEEGVQYYRNLLNEMLKVNITPMVTIYHWDLPTPLMDLGGWNNPKMIDYFEDYARVVFKLYGDIVKFWTTINEPHIHCYNGYGDTLFVPALNSHGIGEYLCMHYMLLGHARVYHIYDKEFRPIQQGKIGITLDCFGAEPKDPLKQEDQQAVDDYYQMHLGTFAHPIYSKTGDYPPYVRKTVDQMSKAQGYTRSRLPYFSAHEVELLRGSSDFFGLNHYTTYLVTPCTWDETWRVPSMAHDNGLCVTQSDKWPRPGSNWLSVYPEGFRKLLNWIKKNYGDVPILVTENGLCDDGSIADYDRVSYFNKYLYQLLLAMHEDKCNVVGYIAWTLMDDFEWADGYATKFGIYHVDFNSPKRIRTPKLSAISFERIVRTRKIDFEFIKPDTSKYYESNKL